VSYHAASAVKRVQLSLMFVVVVDVFKCVTDYRLSV